MNRRAFLSRLFAAAAVAVAASLPVRFGDEDKLPEWTSIRWFAADTNGNKFMFDAPNVRFAPGDDLTFNGTTYHVFGVAS